MDWADSFKHRRICGQIGIAIENNMHAYVCRYQKIADGTSSSALTTPTDQADMGPDRLGTWHQKGAA